MIALNPIIFEVIGQGHQPGMQTLWLGSQNVFLYVGQGRLGYWSPLVKLKFFMLQQNLYVHMYTFLITKCK